MLDELKDLFREDLQYTHTAAVLQQLGNLVQIINPIHMKNENGKNAAIDVICQLLQSNKDNPDLAAEVQNAID